jgi:hypothetical protein
MSKNISPTHSAPMIILFNAPPRAGKDTVLEMMSGLPYEHMKFAGPLYKMVQSMFGLTDSFWDDLYENFKEVPSDFLNGMTPREAMIWGSESVIKPKFGKEHFGVVAKRSIAIHMSEGRPYFAFSDSGFSEEAGVLVSEYGAENVFLVRIKRPGYDFSNDSRSYWPHEEAGILDEHVYELNNDEGLEELEEKLYTTILTPIRQKHENYFKSEVA